MLASVRSGSVVFYSSRFQGTLFHFVEIDLVGGDAPNFAKNAQREKHSRRAPTLFRYEF